MKTSKNSRRLHLTILLTVLACAGTWAAGEVHSVRDLAEVRKLTEKKRTVCVGRFLVDVPASADLRISNVIFDRFQVDTLLENEQSFQSRVATREADIGAGGENSVRVGPVEMVEARNLHVMGMIGRMLVYQKRRNTTSASTRGTEDMSIEAHAHTGGVTFTLSADFADLLTAKAAENLLARLRLRAKEEIPSTPGFCIERAVFTDPISDPKTGAIAMHIGVPNHPDLALLFQSIPGGSQRYSLIERVAGRDISSKIGELLRVTKLRKQMRSIDGMDGEEVLERVRELNFATTYGFVWASDGPQDDALRPPLTLELQAGIGQVPSKPIDASLHEPAVLVLWDSIASSIRLRNKNQKSRLAERG